MAKDNDNMLEGNALDDVSLESILAEYKGSAYINGDKKTPPELLKEQADKIILEAIGNTQFGSQYTPDKIKIEDWEYQEVPDPEPEFNEKQPPPPGPVTKTKPEREAAQTPELEKVRKPARENVMETDKVLLYFNDSQSPRPEPDDSIVRDVEKAIEREIWYGDEAKAQVQEVFNSPDHTLFDYDEQLFEEQNISEDEIFIEPDLKEASVKFSAAYNSISLRTIPAALITLIMIILTFAFEAGMTLPFNIGNSHSASAGALVISLLVVMMLCADIIVRGAENLVRGTLNVETLILFSCAFSLISGVFSIINDTSGILPYCAVSALSLTCAAIGEKYNLRAIAETLKTASGSAEPYGVQAEFNADIKKSVLKKVYNRTDGFYNNLMHPDITETVYRFAAPVLLASALVLSIISALARGQGQYFLHILSALLAAAAPFSAMLAFSLPFHTIARSIRKSGAAIAGWGGADDVCSTDGACVTDNDLFPSGTLKINGNVLLGGASLEKALRYTASLIIASGSGLTGIFSEEMNSQGMKKFPVEDFAFHEAGGVSGLIRGERVMTGSTAFMTLQHFDIPEEMKMKNAVFTAIDNKLVVMFAINYSPQKSVQSALKSILRWQIKLFFAVRDFNLTPSALQNKFRVSLEDIEFIQTKDSYSISDTNSGKEGRMAAVLIREGFSPFAEAVTGGKLLKTTALVAAVISVVSAAGGVLLMFYMCWAGAFMSAKPGNLLLFMLAMLAAVLIVCGYARLRK